MKTTLLHKHAGTFKAVVFENVRPHSSKSALRFSLVIEASEARRNRFPPIFGFDGYLRLTSSPARSGIDGYVLQKFAFQSQLQAR